MRLLIQLIVCLHLLAPVIAFAQSQSKDPLSYPLKQWALVLGLALFGGLASWWTKVRNGEIAMHNFGHLVGELTISAFAGVITFFGCEWAGLAPLLTAAIVGISGHMGTRAIALAERYAERRFAKSAPKEDQ